MNETKSTGSHIVGLAILDQFNGDPFAHYPEILSGKYDEDILAYFRFVDSSKTDEALNAALSSLKTMIRNSVQKGIDAAYQKYEEDIKQKAISNFKAMSKVSEQGTTAEIAARLGVSKSEVRRMKREGLI